MMLANVAMIYAIASVCYIALTRRLGTPLTDSLSEKQLDIKKRAVVERKCSFLIGIAASFVVMLAWRPFS